MADIAHITGIVEPEAKALGFDLVRVKIMASEAGDGDRALQIMAEDPATGQLVIDQCAALSRRVSERLDALEASGDAVIEGSYLLEVSSPGIDRPLTRPADFEKWAGHEAKIALAEKIDDLRNLRGRLIGIEGDIVSIEDNRAGRFDLPLCAIHAAKLVLTDELIAATQPIDTTGAEDVLEEQEE